MSIYISMGLPIIGVIWAGGILIVSFLLLLDMPNKPHKALLCTFGATAAFLKIMFCGFLLRALKQRNISECRVWLVINLIMTVLIEILIVPVYYWNFSIQTPFEISAITITAAYSCCLIFFIFSLPALSKEPNRSLLEACATL